MGYFVRIRNVLGRTKRLNGNPKFASIIVQAIHGRSQHMHVQLRDMQMHFDMEGPAIDVDGEYPKVKPTVVFIHGAIAYSDHMAFRPYFSKLRDKYNLIYLDLRGSGDSTAGNQDRWNLLEMARDVTLFFDALGLERPILFGNCFGGYVAQQLATTFPETIGGLIISSIGTRLNIDEMLAAFLQVGGKRAMEVAERYVWTATDEAGHRRAFREFMVHCVPLCHTTDQKRRFNRIPNMNMEVAHSLYCPPDGEWQHLDFTSALANVTCPTLVMTGDKDPMCTVQESREVWEALPRELASFVTIENAGHGPYHDNPEDTRNALSAFVSQIS